MTINFGDRVFVNDDVLNAASKLVIETIAKAVPEECLCTAVIDEILEKAKARTRAMPIAFFQQCLEANKR